MKNTNIINLVNSGFLDVTAHTVNSACAYKIFKFKKEIRRAFAAIQESESEILSAVGIGDPNKFNADLNNLRKAGPSEDLAHAEEVLSQFKKLSGELYNDDTPIQTTGRISFEEWKALQDENHDENRDILTGYIEEFLEGVLWEAPAE